MKLISIFTMGKNRKQQLIIYSKLFSALLSTNTYIYISIGMFPVWIRMHLKYCCFSCKNFMHSWFIQASLLEVWVYVTYLLSLLQGIYSWSIYLSLPSFMNELLLMYSRQKQKLVSAFRGCFKVTSHLYSINLSKYVLSWTYHVI